MNSNNNIVTNVSAFKMNPDSLDLAILDAFTVQSGGLCGTSTQIAVVVENRGANAVNTFTVSAQVGSASASNQNYTSTNLSRYTSLHQVLLRVAIYYSFNSLMSMETVMTKILATMNLL